MSIKGLPHDHGHSGRLEELQAQLSNTDKFSVVSDVFKQLGDTTRLRIFWLLCHCEECVLNIAAMMDMSSPAIAHHLKLLRDNGLVVSCREGKEVYYRAADTPQSNLLHVIIEQVMEITCPE